MSAIAAAMAVLCLSACTIDGSPSARDADLAPRSVSADAFPDRVAGRVPTPAIEGAIADITGAPLGAGKVTPADCTPPTVSPDGAVAFVGHIDGGSASLSTLIAYAANPLTELTDTVSRCGEYRTGDERTATSTTRTELLPPPPARDGVETAAIARTSTTGGASAPLVTSITTLIAQRDGVRVYVEYRGRAAQTPAPMTAESGALLDELFTAAVSTAWPVQG